MISVDAAMHSALLILLRMLTLMNKKNLAALQNDGCLSWRFRDQLCDIDWKSHSGNSAPVKIGT